MPRFLIRDKHGDKQYEGDDPGDDPLFEVLINQWLNRETNAGQIWYSPHPDSLQPAGDIKEIEILEVFTTGGLENAFAERRANGTSRLVGGDG